MGFSALLDPQNREVGQKLGLATVLMFTLPILTFFAVGYVARIQQWSGGPDNWAGGAAILMTNCIVGGYCYSAYKEDLNDETKANNNDEDAPRVGIYKQRVD